MGVETQHLLTAATDKLQRIQSIQACQGNNKLSNGKKQPLRERKSLEMRKKKETGNKVQFTKNEKEIEREIAECSQGQLLCLPV